MVVRIDPAYGRLLAFQGEDHGQTFGHSYPPPRRRPMKKEVKVGRRKMLAAGAASLVGLAAFSTPAAAQPGKHPRLDKAILDMEDALEYLRAAPKTFGGHKKA